MQSERETHHVLQKKSWWITLRDDCLISRPRSRLSTTLRNAQRDSKLARNLKAFLDLRLYFSRWCVNTHNWVNKHFSAERVATLRLTYGSLAEIPNSFISRFRLQWTLRPGPWWPNAIASSLKKPRKPPKYSLDNGGREKNLIAKVYWNSQSLFSEAHRLLSLSSPQIRLSNQRGRPTKRSLYISAESKKGGRVTLNQRRARVQPLLLHSYGS